MTVIDATEKLWKWYLENDVFVYPENYSKLLIIDDKEDSCKAAVLLALIKMKESKLINNIKIKEKEYWILEKNFKSFSQTLEISPLTAKSIFDIISSYCDSTEDKTQLPDILNIKDKDIQNLVIIIYSLNEKLNKTS